MVLMTTPLKVIYSYSWVSSFFCKDGKKKDKSFPGRISVLRWVGLDNSEHFLRKLFRAMLLVTSTGKLVGPRIYRLLGAEMND